MASTLMTASVVDGTDAAGAGPWPPAAADGARRGDYRGSRDPGRAG